LKKEEKSQHFLGAWATTCSPAKLVIVHPFCLENAPCVLCRMKYQVLFWIMDGECSTMQMELEKTILFISKRIESNDKQVIYPMFDQ